MNVLRFAARCLACMLVAVVGWGTVSGQAPLIDDLPPDPRVRVLEQRFHHETFGTGFLVEIDLGQLPPWTGDLVIKPVDWPIPEVRRHRQGSDDLLKVKNPLAALGIGLGKLFSLGGGTTKTTIPLTAQLVYPLSDSTVRNRDSSLTVKLMPQNKRIRLLVPHAVVQDSDRVYFMLNDGQFKTKVNFLYTAQLFPDTLLPDLRVVVQGEQKTRYAGAAGKMITVHYRFPDYLLKYTTKWFGMTPELRLNGKYPMPKPAGYPRSWDFVKTASGDLTFFMPDALYDSSGRAYVEMSFKANKSPRIGYARVELEGEGRGGTTWGMSVLDLQQKRPQWKDGCYVSNKIQLGVGGVAIWESEVASSELSDKNHLRWPNCPEVLMGLGDHDSLTARVRHYSQDIYGYPATIFYINPNLLKQDKNVATVQSKFSDEYFRYDWRLHLRYERLK